MGATQWRVPDCPLEQATMLVDETLHRFVAPMFVALYNALSVWMGRRSEVLNRDQSMSHEVGIMGNPLQMFLVMRRIVGLVEKCIVLTVFVLWINKNH